MPWPLHGMGGAFMRPRNPSRRKLLKSGAPFPLIPLETCSRDPAISVAIDWLACEAEYDTVVDRWGPLETHLRSECDWRQLSHRQRAVIPMSCKLDAIDDRMDAPHERKKLFGAALLSLAATSVRAAALGLAVAYAFASLGKNPEGHRLISSIVRDF